VGQKFEEYLQEKLAHLGNAERWILGPVLRKYKHLFYGKGSTQLGSTSQVEHSIDRGCKAHKTESLSDSSCVEISYEHTDDIQKEIIERSVTMK